MNPIYSEEVKSQATAFIPYRRNGDDWEFYLQKRSVDAPTTPGVFGFFGGALEKGETPDEGVTREIEEELAYVPAHLEYFNRYEFVTNIRYVFIEQVSQGFEANVQVNEGDYGAFISSESIIDPAQFGRTAFRVILPDLADYLRSLPRR